MTTIATPRSVTAGSVAGFRVQQTVLGLTSDVVGRTGDVTGTVRVDGGRVTTAHMCASTCSR